FYFSQITFSIQGGHTTCASGSDSLPVDMVLCVPTCENSFNIGPSTSGNRLDITVVIHVQMALENFCVRLMSDGHKKPAYSHLFYLLGQVILYPYSFNF